MASDGLIAGRILVDGALVDGVVERTEGVITAVRAREGGDPPGHGLVVPGLVNAHTHLELSWSRQVGAPAMGFRAWFDAMREVLPAPDGLREAALHSAAGDLHDLGTAIVCDISNRGDTAADIERAGLQGIVQHEVMGWNRTPALKACDGAVPVRPSPHAIYSTPPQLIRAAVGHPGPIASIHLGEDPAERVFTTDGTGDFAGLLADLGITPDFTPPGCSPVAYLRELGVLGPGLLLVHMVDIDADDVVIVRESGSPVCLCPRSNLHIGGRLPDVPAFLAAGVPLAVGTDSLASSPDLDVLGEVAVLIEAFPAVDPVAWLHAATEGGAAVLGFEHRIAVGSTAPLLRIDVDDVRALVDHPPHREWV